ncbi:hypothetical protein MP228_000313 [Amoeboaphelidium protococcarum]|nr:hypothetical protein MP228_000313 [Amoeboaphelidium protococcarum]
MTFGEHLKDQLPVIDKYTQNGLTLAQEIRDFIKERSQLEKDYAHKLDSLSKRYSSKKEKLGMQLMDVSSAGGNTNNVSFAGSDKYGTLFKAWDAMLLQTEELAKVKIQFSDNMITQVTDQFKTLIHKKDESRKKHMTFAGRLNEEKAKAINDKDKSKEKYDHMCDVVDQAKTRHEKAPDEKTAEKLKKQWQADVMEMNNSKNNYILAVKVANALKKKYYFQDMPQLMDQMQQMNEARVTQTKQLLDEYLRLEIASLDQARNVIDVIHGAVESVSAEQDSNIFIGYHRPAVEWTEPYDYKFEPTLLWKESEDIEVNDAAKIYLINKLGKVRAKLEETVSELDVKTKEVEGLKNLQDAYVKNPTTGDPDEVLENIIESNRGVVALESSRMKYQVCLDVINGAIGEQDHGKRHCLVKSTFAIPTSCDYCQDKIWGLTQQGLTCKECGYNCHAKCEMKVPPYCGIPKSQQPQPSHSSSKKTTTSTSLGASPVSNGGQSQPAAIPNVPTAPAPGNIGKALNTVQQQVQALVLYDYTAGNSDEISITAGESINVVDEEDDAGWIKVSKNGKVGLAPKSYLEIKTAPIAPSSTKQMFKAIYDYEAQTAQELSIKEGDLVEVTKQGDDGWWYGSVNGRKGEFPGSYVEPA